MQEKVYANSRIRNVGNDKHPTKYTVQAKIEEKVSVRVNIDAVRSPWCLCMCGGQIVRATRDNTNLAFASNRNSLLAIKTLTLRRR